MVIRKADAETEAGALPTQELLDAMLAYHEEMAKAGILISGDGPKPSSAGSRVKFTNGKPTVYDGPFAETKELVAGYSVIEIGSKEEAIELIKKWPVLDAGGNVEIEIRPFYEFEDFGEVATPDLRDVYETTLGRGKKER
jgi:hypothetical protein